MARRTAVIELAFLAFASAVSAYVLAVFVDSMLKQTGGQWSLPLDDVFIHFDYARSTARGHPFQWSEGDGYSSGGTSLTYPLVLGFGYRIGFSGLALCKWALFVAFAGVSGFLLGTKRLFDPLGEWAKFVLPPLFFSIGALDFSLASGMENAFLLGLVGAALALIARLDQEKAGRADRRHLMLGGANVLLVLSRPEAIVFALALSGFAVWRVGRRGGPIRVGLATFLPPVTAVLVVGLINRISTGDWAPAGAIGKLALYDPYLSWSDRFVDWRANLEYVFLRLTLHHFSDRAPYGFIPVALALVPLASSAVRRYAVLFWSMVVSWILLVSLNDQIRYQNERYAMPAVALLLVLAAMGVAVLIGRLGEGSRAKLVWGGRMVATLAILFLSGCHQGPNFKEQLWFFGRSSRNIRDQQIAVGHLLGRHSSDARRVLVNDAGAITYASDLPGLDLLGLGGYRGLPFARASREGLGATLELLERVPEGDRPDVMAIYPGWWGDMPLYFGHYAGEVAIDGNVICGADSVALYRADWDAFDRESEPRSLSKQETVFAELDVADVVSERAASYQRPSRNPKQVVFRVLTDPGDKHSDLFDAGRMVEEGEKESFTLPLPPHGGRLILRTVTTKPVSVTVRVDGAELGTIEVPVTDGWVEPSIEIPRRQQKESLVELSPSGGAFVDFHFWAVAAD